MVSRVYQGAWEHPCAPFAARQAHEHLHTLALLNAATLQAILGSWGSLLGCLLIAGHMQAQGVKGIPCIWHVAPELVDKFRLQPDVPESITDRVDKAARRRVQRARKGAAAAAAAGRDAAASQRALKAEAAAIAAAAFADVGRSRGEGQVRCAAPVLRALPVNLE